MKRPRIALESSEHINQVYEHYRNYVPSRVVSHLVWRASVGFYEPFVLYLEGADEEVRNTRERGVPHIFAFNHITNVHDQFVSAATLRKVAPETTGRTRVLTKDPVMRLLGPVGDKLGGIPVFRKKDNDNTELLELANNEMFDTAAHVLMKGQSLAVYPEGTHNKLDPSVLGTVRSGIGEIATRVVAQGRPLIITPIGMSYGQPGAMQNPMRANVVVGHSFGVWSGDTVQGVTDQTASRLQTAVTAAFTHPEI